MKLDTASEQFEVKGRPVKEQEMTVKNTSKLFSLMIDGLYQDKYGSVIRELSANAIDVHKSCGVTRPFEITIPNGIVNNFIIRDFGNGLSKDEIVKYFGTLLESSKDSDNNSIGAFGLGCKSPFSLVNEFSVSSIKNGRKTTVLFIRENFGTPKFFVIYEGNTDEESGTSIFFEDKTENAYKKWVDAIERQLCALTQKPIIHNYDDINYPEIITYGNIGYVKPGELPNKYYINMGQILYPININDFADEDVDFIKSNYTVIYNCDIGDITVPPDRERVEISAKTVNTIKRITKNNISDIANEVCERFKIKYNNDYETIKQFIFESIFLGINTAEIISPHINLEKLIGTDNYLYLKNINPNEKKHDYALLNDIISTQNRKIFMHPSLNVYSCNNDEAELLNSSNISISNIFDSKLPIYISNDARVIDINEQGYNNGYKRVKFIRVRHCELQSFEKLLKSLSSLFGYNPDMIYTIHKDKNKQHNKYIANQSRAKLKIKTRGLKVRYSSYDYGRLSSEDVDALLSDEPVIMLKAAYSSNTENVYESEINSLLSLKKVKIFKANHDQYILYKDRPNVYTFKNFVETFAMTDDYFVAKSFVERNEYKNLFDSRLVREKSKSILSNKALISKIIDELVNNVIGDKLEIGIKDVNNHFPIIENSYEDVISNIKLSRNDVMNIATKFVNKRIY